jgi:hypothetical protein
MAIIFQLLVITYPGVNPGVRYINQQVHQQDYCSKNYGQVLDNDIVLSLNAGHE